MSVLVLAGTYSHLCLLLCSTILQNGERKVVPERPTRASYFKVSPDQSGSSHYGNDVQREDQNQSHRSSKQISKTYFQHHHPVKLQLSACNFGFSWFGG